MPRSIALATLLCLCLASQAQELPEAPSVHIAPARDPAWDRVEQLPQDADVSILERGKAGPTPCQLDHADEQVLVCIPYGSPRRLIFPRRQIEMVRTNRQVQTIGYGPLIAVAVVTGIFAIAGGVQNGGQGAAAGAFIGGLISSGFAGAIAHNQRPHFRTESRIVYRAP